jgi:hypothetical protein
MPYAAQGVKGPHDDITINNGMECIKLIFMFLDCQRQDRRFELRPALPEVNVFFKLLEV